MSMYLVSKALKARSVGFCILSLAACIPAASVAHADDECLNVATSMAEPDFSPCDSDLPQIDLDAALQDHAGAKPAASAASAMPWIAQQDKGVPLQVNSSNSNVSLRTSLDDLKNFNTRTFVIDQSGASTPALPKINTTPNLPVDVWTSVDVKGYEGDRDQSTRTGLGVDYKLSRSAVMGVSVERGDARSASAAPELDSKASAYVTLQATPLISVDARTEWQAGNAGFAAANGASEKSAVILAPKIDHSFALGDGKTISPFVTYKREFEMSTGAATLTTPERSAGAGVTYKDSDIYTLSVTTDVDAATATTPQSVNSKFKLSVPIN